MTEVVQFLPASYAIITHIENTKSNGMPGLNTLLASISVVKFAIWFSEIREALIGISVEKQNLQAWARATNLCQMFEDICTKIVDTQNHLMFSLTFPKLDV